MTESLTIPQNPQLRESQDFYALRKAGLEYLESIATKWWTDFNTHDSGITILEVLSYAITDLGYRTDFQMSDILAEETEGEHSNQFHTAKNILTNRAFSELDYRKLLIDILGIDNAWLACTERGEIKMWADCEESQLITTQLPDLEEVKVRGLYNVLLELGTDREVGDLNSALLTHTISRGDLAGLTVEVLLPKWKKSDADLLAFAGAESINSISVADAELKKNYWQADFTINFKTESGNSSIELKNIKSTFISNKNGIEISIEKLEKEWVKNVLGSIFFKYHKKLKRVGELIAETRAKLMANRNLCEDFLDIQTVPIEDVAICADLDLENDANLEEVQAQVCHELQWYLSPPIHAYTLKELLDLGLSPDEIFNGPMLEHGFILDEELHNSKLGACIYASDIVNILMDISGVKAVKNLMMTQYDELGNRKVVNRKWTLQISQGHKPRLAIRKSKFLLFKSDIPFLADTEETLQRLEMLNGLTEPMALLEHENDLPIPDGKLRNLEEHYTVQDEFPLTYGIGKKGLPLNQNLNREQQNLRKAQAKQLKGYLLFFDQLLANYLSQLKNTKNLYGWDEETKLTYFSQYLKNINGIDGDFEGEYYQNLDADSLQKLFENETLFLERRNRFLNHLIGRFAEQFSEYSALVHSMKKLDDETDADVKREMIADKTRFLCDYPQLSSERGKGLDYSDENEIWHTANVSGFEKRVGRLLGFNDFHRRKLECAPIEDLFEKYKDIEDQWRFRVRTHYNRVLFRSEGYLADASIENGISSVMENGIEEEQYRRETAVDGTFYFNLIAKNNKIIGTSMFHETAAARDKNIVELQYMLGRKCEDEGMHLVEHVLLRPKFQDDRLMEVCLEENCKTCGEEDPYSFRASVVLPYWPERFRTMEFRRFAERVMRLEIPAHIAIKICWVDENQMEEFETAWRAWLEENAKENPDETALKAKLAALTEVLQNLKNIHPQAHLHDCVDSENENPVMLGNTVLGQFDPIESPLNPPKGDL